MFDKIFQAIGLPLLLAGLSACANPSYVTPSHPIKIFQMERPVYFLSSEVPACGDPIAQEDVLVVNVDIDEDIGKAVQRQAGIGAEYSDRWFRYNTTLAIPNTPARIRDFGTHTKTRAVWVNTMRRLISGTNLEPSYERSKSKILGLYLFPP